ncbi:MAG: hypothetical protein QM296_05970 [Bacillota bacterium]|nr:hypothetical protein [Bacillota bacterium]
MRWCPETGAGTKKLSKGGQKLRWCPEIGAGTKKLATAGQKMRWCPEIGAGTKKLSRSGQKLPFVPANLGTNPDFWPQLAPNYRLSPQAHSDHAESSIVVRKSCLKCGK